MRDTRKFLVAVVMIIACAHKPPVPPVCDDSALAAQWQPSCGNGICEIDEAASTCSEDCRAHDIDREPFVLHGGPVPDRLADLHAATRLIIGRAALGATPAQIANADQ